MCYSIVGSGGGGIQAFEQPLHSYSYLCETIIIQRSLILANVNGRLASLSDSGGFRKYIQANAVACGITGSVQRYRGYQVRLSIEGTEDQLNEFESFLRICVDQEMIESLKLETEYVSRRRVMQVFKILKDHTRLGCESRPQGVMSGPYSGNQFEKETDYSSDSYEVRT
jgi:acylphosphatase